MSTGEPDATEIGHVRFGGGPSEKDQVNWHLVGGLSYRTAGSARGPGRRNGSNPVTAPRAYSAAARSASGAGPPAGHAASAGRPRAWPAPQEARRATDDAGDVPQAAVGSFPDARRCTARFPARAADQGGEHDARLGLRARRDRWLECSD